MPSRETAKISDFRLPAEWEPQAAVWFAWPVRQDLWSGQIQQVRQQLAALYVLAARYQTVRVLCPRFAQGELIAALQTAGGLQGIELFDYQTDDVWIRDFGPLFMVNAEASELAVVDWAFNAWGNKFPEQARDNAASKWIAEQLKLRRFGQPFVLEGGAIESNGAGVLLTTEAVLLNPNRRGPGSIEGVEGLLADGLCIDRVLWLKDGLAGDDTDGHIDNLARFFAVDGILVAMPAATDTANTPALQENRRRIQQMETDRGLPYRIVELPLPNPFQVEGRPLAASYLNYLVLNDAVLVPTFNQPEQDAQALQIIASCFPTRQIVGFDCCKIVQEGGALHCMSQNQPAL